MKKQQMKFLRLWICVFTLDFYVLSFGLYDHFYGSRKPPCAYFTHDPLRPLLIELRAAGASHPRKGLARIHRAACQNVDAKLTNAPLRSGFKREMCLGTGRNDEVAWTCRCTRLPSEQDTSACHKNADYFLAKAKAVNRVDLKVACGSPGAEFFVLSFQDYSLISRANNKRVKTVKNSNKYSENLNIVGFCGPDGGDSS